MNRISSFPDSDFSTRSLITGGTGFVGSSLVPRLRRDSSDVLVIGRGPRPETLSPSCRYLQHDILLPLGLAEDFDVVVHAATPASAELNYQRPDLMLETIIKGTTNIINWAGSQRAAPTVLLVSSGGVYGDLEPGQNHFTEECTAAPSTLEAKSAYAEGKRVSELLLSIATLQGVCIGLIARLFAFSGPHLPRDRHFAIGNFVRDAINNQRISVRGDGRAVRSYLDERDMAEWLMAILRRGEPGFPYHVGSERAISIRDLAHLTADRYSLMTGNHCDVEILGQTSPLDGVSRYVPSTKKTRELLGVEETISLEESLDSMIEDALVNDSTPH